MVVGVKKCSNTLTKAGKIASNGDLNNVQIQMPYEEGNTFRAFIKSQDTHNVFW